jgi:hypothetical protein
MNIEQGKFMRFIFVLLGLAGSAFAQTQAPAPAPEQAPAPRQGPIITWEDANDQDYYGYNGYYYGGGYYGYGGGYGGRGRDWNNYSDGRYEDRGNHRGAITFEKTFDSLVDDERFGTK